VEVVAREDGRFEYQEQVYALAEGFPQFGLPGWSLPLRIKNIALYRHYATYGSMEGDLRPPVSEPRLGGVAEIDGWINRVGVLGQPKTETTEFSVSIYSYDGAKLGTSDWDRRARKSWPVSVLRLTEPHEEILPWSLTAYLPRQVFEKIADAVSTRRLERLRLETRVEGFYVLDVERPNGQGEGWAAYLPPADEEGQAAVLHGYISDLTVDESRLDLKLDDGGPSVPTSEPTPAPAALPGRARVRVTQSIFWALVGLVIGVGIDLIR
jgi:hypothetical protein